MQGHPCVLGVLTLRGLNTSPGQLQHLCAPWPLCLVLSCPLLTPQRVLQPQTASRQQRGEFGTSEPELLQPRCLITASTEALSTHPSAAGFGQATHVFSCPLAKVFGRTGHMATGQRARCSFGAEEPQKQRWGLHFSASYVSQQKAGEPAVFITADPLWGCLPGWPRGGDLGGSVPCQREDTAPLPLHSCPEPSEALVVLLGAVSSLGLNPVCCSVVS